jgi:hypothetical protein
MQPEVYLFVPLADPLHEQPQDRPQAWDERQFLSRSRILANLKLYGRRVGIPEHKLTLMALRRTATRLKLDEQACLQQMIPFLDTREQAKAINYRLKRLPSLPQDEPRSGDQANPEPLLPDRKPVRFQPGEGITHGFYARSQPPEAVIAVLAENIQGLEAEIVGMRTLARGLLDRQEQAGSSAEAAQLGDAYIKAASQFAKLIQAENQLTRGGEANTWADEVLAAMDHMAIELGMAPVGEAARAEALGGKPELAASDRRLVEEIAAMRHVLRNTFALAWQAQETREYIHLTEIYNSGCVRLVRLLRLEGADQDRLTAYLREQIDQALDQVTRELDIRI